MSSYYVFKILDNFNLVFLELYIRDELVVFIVDGGDGDGDRRRKSIIFGGRVVGVGIDYYCGLFELVRNLVGEFIEFGVNFYGDVIIVLFDIVVGFDF